MTEKILTIIIPAYNVEKYIEECLSSLEVRAILPQLEILVVDDGGQDKTMEIAKKFAEQYPDSYKLCFKENGGHGSVINYGIKLATGKYLKVIDGDDWVNSQNMPDFIELLDEIDSDVVANDYECIRDGDKKVLSHRKACTNAFHYSKEWGFSEAVNEPVIKIHSLTLKTSVAKRMQEAGILLDEHCFYEDAEWIMYPIPFAETVYFDSAIIYEYRLGRSGQSVDIKSLQKNKGMHEQVLDSLLHYLAMLEHGEHPVSKQIVELQGYKRLYMEKGIAMLVQNQFQIFLSLGNSKDNRREMIEFDTRLRDRFPGVYKAVTKKSIWMIRGSKYRLFGLACLAYKILRR